jgi:hypothetical protein
MSKLLGAMKLRMKEIVIVEGRPFSYADFMEFEVCGQKHKMSYGTFRNNISKLKKARVVKAAFNSKPAFYTIPDYEFDKSMTLDRMGANYSSIIDDALLKQTPLYNWLKKRPAEKQALHDIRLTFKAAGIFMRTWLTLIIKTYNCQL